MRTFAKQELFDLMSDPTVADIAVINREPHEDVELLFIGCETKITTRAMKDRNIISRFTDAVTPAAIIADDGHSPLQMVALRVSGDRCYLDFENAPAVEIFGDILCEHAISMLYSLLDTTHFESFGMSVVTNAEFLPSLIQDKIDFHIQRSFTKTTGRRWSMLVDDCRGPQPHGPACNCHRWAPCVNDTGNGRSCSTFRAKCHGDCGGGFALNRSKSAS